MEWLARAQSAAVIMGHPSLRLLLWATVVLLLQRLGAPGLALLLVLAYVLAGDRVRGRWSRLVWRSRWLLLVLALTYLLSTPGEAVVAGYWPTWEGLLAGLEQAGRIVAVLGAVGWLLATTPVERLVAGIYGLAVLLRGRRAGLGRAERAAVRLALVLRYAENARASDWRMFLQEPVDVRLEPVSIDLPALRGRDWSLALLALVLAVAFVWWSGA